MSKIPVKKIGRVPTGKALFSSTKQKKVSKPFRFDKYMDK